MPLLERHDKNAIAYLKMNAPEKLNALSEGMLSALQAEFDALKEDRSVRAVIISGAGKAFCAGHDLKEMTQGRQAEDGGKAYFKALFEKCATMMSTIRTLPQPVIAQVHGIATAAGGQLVASCDLAVAIPLLPKCTGLQQRRAVSWWPAVTLPSQMNKQNLG